MYEFNQLVSLFDALFELASEVILHHHYSDKTEEHHVETYVQSQVLYGVLGFWPLI